MTGFEFRFHKIREEHHVPVGKQDLPLTLHVCLRVVVRVRVCLCMCVPAHTDDCKQDMAKSGYDLDIYNIFTSLSRS